jgi:hypothetical protein
MRGSSVVFGFELFVTDTEFFSSVAHQYAQFPYAQIADFMHADQQRCANR